MSVKNSSSKCTFVRGVKNLLGSHARCTHVQYIGCIGTFLEQFGFEFKPSSIVQPHQHCEY